MALILTADDLSTYQTARQDDDDPPDRREADRKRRLVAACIERRQISVSAYQKQSDRETEDLKFDRALPEDQWPAEIRKSRGGGIGLDGRAIAERPCLVIPKLDQPVQQIINEIRSARLEIDIKAKGDGADTEGAELRQGLIRAIVVESRAPVARLWAVDRGVKCGRGFYRVMKQYANDGDNDLDLAVVRIKDQSAVHLDPYASEPDWSDGEWAVIDSRLTREEYARRYPRSKLAHASAVDIAALDDTATGWIGEDDVLVAEYFYVDHRERTLIRVPGVPRSLYADEWSGDLPLDMQVLRTVDQRSVRWCVVNALEVLEEEDWEGRYIPIVPYLGKEYNVNGESCYKGVIANAKDAQKSYNYMRSAQVEAVGLAPRAPWIMYEGQDEGYEGMWDQANVRNFSRLIVKPTSFGGQPLPLPQRIFAEPAIQAISVAVREADRDIKATTGRFDPSLGNMGPQERSGRAIRELKQQGESGSSNYTDALAYCMNLEARILLDLLPYVYDRPGRIVRVLGEEPGDERHVMIKQPFTPGPDGMPVATPQQPTGGLPGLLQSVRGMLPGGKPEPPPKVYDLSQGHYNVVVSVGRSFQSQREENANMMETILKAAPATAPLVLDLWADNLDGPIAKKVAKRLRAANPPKDDEGGQPSIPPELQQQLAQLQQQNQQLTQALTETSQQLQSEQQKLEVEVMLKREELASRERIAAMQLRADLVKAEELSSAKAQAADLKAQQDSLVRRAEHDHAQVLLAATQHHGDQSAMRDALMTAATRPAVATPVTPPAADGSFEPPSAVVE